jgi:hypothetical protein
MRARFSYVGWACVAGGLIACARLLLGEPAGAAPRRVEVEVPRTWDEAALATLDVPLADPAATPVHLPADYYYKVPVREIWKSYPVYRPGSEPAGYLDGLRQAAPQTVFDPAKLASEADWIAAGERVFDAALVYDALVTVAEVHDPAWYARTAMPVAKDGTVPFFRYVVREKGKVELGQFACATCHTRVMPGGSVIKGAQGNFPVDRLDAMNLREKLAQAADPAEYLKTAHARAGAPWGAPWLGEHDPQKREEAMSIEQIAAAGEAIPPGVQARFGASLFDPVQVPDLIGVRERTYLDRTGHVKHRSAGDLMRYAALQQGMAFFDRFGTFTPSKLPPKVEYMSRYSDEMLYALALYIYSLQPPPNPNPFDREAARGKIVFDREGCEFCHQPPLYTRNKLLPVAEYRPAAGSVHPQSQDIIPFPIGTDPGLTLHTRRGTGFYKVPSLKGVWYRGPFEHSGSVATLEDWFDGRRLHDDYVPTGFRGYGVKTRAVKGHPFGLDLSPQDKKALIAFLKTL